MNIILSILVALFFTLFWLLKLQWYFEIWKIDLVGVENIFEVDLSYIKHSINYIFYIPELIFNNEKVLIKEFFIKYINLSEQEIYIWVMFFYHLTLSFIVEAFTRVIWWFNHKKHVVVWMIWIYLLIISITRFFITS
jgi:hypothetical protein